MSLWSLASNASVWRGYDYYKQGKVVSYEMLSDGVYEGYIQGSTDDPYHTVIDVEHPRKSHCNCPFAEGRRVICKHMVALLFTVFPKEADAFMDAVEESEKEEEFWRQEHYKELEHFVKGLKKDELQRELLIALIELEERDGRYW
ncbi:MAG: SWIM zinc finger domain-containing protein [Clostridiales Family XIII bacterium]|jgi:uncharacterized Zn finger protein|nr:SWIM zinc finger domain-containing protein [Clostridiales Family XIII bacterium]